MTLPRLLTWLVGDACCLVLASAVGAGWIVTVALAACWTAFWALA